MMQLTPVEKMPAVWPRTVIAMIAGVLALTACTTTPPKAGYGTSSPSERSSSSASRACSGCGVVLRIEAAASAHSASRRQGAVLGGIVGAVASRPVSKGTDASKDSTQAAANSGTYRITVRMDDGRSMVLDQPELAGVRENSAVRVLNGRVVLR